MRLALLAALVTLAGCCITVVSGGTGNYPPETSAGSNVSTGAGPSTAAGSTGSTGGSPGTPTGASGGTSGGTSAGAGVPNLVPTYLLDAGAGTLFGPVALASQASALGTGIAKLMYSAGVSRSFDVRLQALSGDGAALGAPFLAATTSSYVTTSPNVAVFDDGTHTGACWEDVGVPANPIGSPFRCSTSTADGGLLRCSTFRDRDSSVAASYDVCSGQYQAGVTTLAPALVFNPASFALDLDGTAQLFYSDWWVGQIIDWAYGSKPNGDGEMGPWEGGIICNAADECQGFSVSELRAPIAPGWTVIAHSTPHDGLVIAATNFPSEEPAGSLVTADPGFSAVGQVAIASDLGSQTASVLELDNHGFRATLWVFDGGVVGKTPIAQPDGLTGPLSAGTCANGFGYLAMTDGGLFVSESTFDGELMPDAGMVYLLDDFEAAVTTMAVATDLKGGLLLAVSNPGQIAVYRVPCR